MHHYLARRLLIMVPIFLGITMMSYGIMALTPGDPVQMLIAPGMSAEDMAVRRRDFGLDRPVYVRYVKWLGQVVRGNLGYSFSTGAPVTRRVGERIVPTLKLTGAALVMSYALGIPVGVIAATKRYSAADYVATVLTFLGISLPTFFLGLAGIYVFALRVRWLPVGGTMTLGGDGGFLDGLHHLILPASVLAVAGAGAVTRYVRSSMLDVLGADFVRTARAKGVAEAVVVRRHALRNALIPVITLAGLQIPALLAGAVITEQIFEWPGMGRLTIEAINQRDYPVLMAITMITALLVAVGNLLADVAYAAVDPRIHYE